MELKIESTYLYILLCCDNSDYYFTLYRLIKITGYMPGGFCPIITTVLLYSNNSRWSKENFKHSCTVASCVTWNDIEV